MELFEPSYFLPLANKVAVYRLVKCISMFATQNSTIFSIFLFGNTGKEGGYIRMLDETRPVAWSPMGRKGVG